MYKIVNVRQHVKLCARVSVQTCSYARACVRVFARVFVRACVCVDATNNFV